MHSIGIQLESILIQLAAVHTINPPLPQGEGWGEGSNT